MMRGIIYGSVPDKTFSGNWKFVVPSDCWYVIYGNIPMFCQRGTYISGTSVPLPSIYM